MLWLLAACQDPAAPPGGTEAVTLALPGDVRDLLPILSRSAIDATVTDAIYLPLVTPEFDCELHFHPGRILPPRSGGQ